MDTRVRTRSTGPVWPVRPETRRHRKPRGSLFPSPIETALVLLALYPLIALVLFPEGPRLLGARLVSVAVIGAAAASALAVGRWAPEAVRAIAMLIVSFAGIAVTGGVLAKRVTVGVDVRSLSGILFAIGSVALVVIGWRRALHGIRRGWARAAVAIVGTLVVAQLALLPAVFALDATNRPRPKESGRTPADFGITYRDVRIAMPDGVRLSAWWVPSQNGAAVLILPGAGSTRDDVLDHAALLARQGYGTLLLDWRGHGASDGRLNEFGWGTDKDVRTAVSWVLGRQTRYHLVR